MTIVEECEKIIKTALGDFTHTFTGSENLTSFDDAAQLTAFHVAYTRAALSCVLLLAQKLDEMGAS